ncbi:MAG: DNA polymerase III subunit delta [Ruminococcaceae bacterium]|nr:DNA polymerase III subunit delta [Oscillospiraceae bacterium]
MEKGRKKDPALDNLKRDVAENNIGTLYTFHGEEKYLLEYYLGRIRKLLIPEGLEEFNNKRINGKELTMQRFDDEINALPVFSERTLIEIWDYDFSKMSEEDGRKLLELLNDLPEYVCVVFVYDIFEFKLDGRMKINSKIKKLLNPVEFKPADQSDLVAWVTRRFKALDRQISRDDAEYFVFITGGLMNDMAMEVEKTAAYNKGKIIQRASIDAVVTPALDAATYKMTDGILNRNFNTAAKILGDLLNMQEPPHKIHYSISLKMRQLLAARVLYEAGKDKKALAEMCDIRFEFQTRGLMNAARGVSLGWCKRAVQACSESALALNSGGDGKEVLAQLLAELAI